MLMRCENEFCIYWKEEQCCLNEISLDIMGCCQECIYVEIEEQVLQRVREKAIAKYDKAEMQ